MKEKSLDHHEKENHRGRHLDFDIRCIASKTAVSTDFSFIFSFDVEILDPGFHKRRLFLEMLLSIGLNLSVSLPFFDEEFILPLSNWLNVVQRSFDGSAICLSIQVRSGLQMGCQALFYSRNQRLNLQVWSVLSSFNVISNSFTTLASSGPATIHLKSAPGVSVIPIPPPSPLINSLFCSWAWSSGIEEKVLVVFCTVNFPPLVENSLETCGCLFGSSTMSLIWTGSHRE